MSTTPSAIADLRAECAAHGIQLALARGGGLEIAAPQGALTPERLERLKAHKAELVSLLAKIPAFENQQKSSAKKEAERSADPICRCGSATWLEVPIHDGQSVRRDCGRCGRFIEFPVWHGKHTLQNEK